jgi:hypothetical protein
MLISALADGLALTLAEGDELTLALTLALGEEDTLAEIDGLALTLAEGELLIDGELETEELILEETLDDGDELIEDDAEPPPVV